MSVRCQGTPKPMKTEYHFNDGVSPMSPPQNSTPLTLFLLLLVPEECYFCMFFFSSAPTLAGHVCCSQNEASALL